jgi:hypothetical protein
MAVASRRLGRVQYARAGRMAQARDRAAGGSFCRSVSRRVSETHPTIRKNPLDLQATERRFRSQLVA